MKKLLVMILGLTIILLACSDNTEEIIKSENRVKILIGKAQVERLGNVTGLQVNSKIIIGDIIKTDSDGVAVLSLNDGTVDVEVQQNSEFIYIGKTLMELKKGNVWFRVNKLLNDGSQYRLKTPTGIAAVRGTKFFCFQQDEYFGTCHCEGVVDYESNGNYSATHLRDYLVFSKENKTVLIKPEELKFMGWVGTDHKHSAITNSPLGRPLEKIPSEKNIQLLKLIKANFAEL